MQDAIPEACAKAARTAILFLAVLALISQPAKAIDVLTYHNDNARTGQNLSETVLQPGNVNSNSFGRLFTLAVDGKVDAQPLYASAVSVPGNGIHNLLIVATEHDSVYAFDADNGTAIWHVMTPKAGETASDPRNCTDVYPEIGITSTPVIDRTRGPNGAVYVVAMSVDGTGHYHQRLHALDLATGSELFGGPIDIQAKYPGTGDNSLGGFVIFDPSQYKERASLLLLNGVVYTTWASICDNRPDTGWIIGYDASSLAQAGVLNVTPNGNEGAIWMSGAGPAADSTGNIYLLDANGTFDTTLDADGFPVNHDFGNAFLKIAASPSLSVADYFEDNEAYEMNTDTDLGSGGAMVLPDMTDSSGRVWHLAVGAGKDSNLYLVSRDSMGKYTAQGSNNIYQEIFGALPNGIWSMPAYFNGMLYYGPVSQAIMAFQFSNAALSTSPVAYTPNTFAYPGATPSISANGNSNAILWAAENTDPAVLHAYDALTLQELYNSNQAPNGRDHFGTGNKFITPTIANGKVYVGTTNGVGVFGLLNQALSVIPFTPQNGMAGKPYTTTLSASGGQTPYSWSIVSGSLPQGLSLNASTGGISGTPATAGTSNFTARVTDANQQAATGSFSITINPAGSGGSVTLVQSTATEGSGLSSLSVTFPGAVTKSDLVIAFVRMSSTSQTVTVTDSLGNIYHDAVSQNQDADGHQIHLFYAANVSGGAITVTATFSDINNHPWLAIYEYSGISTANPLDQTAHAQGNDNSPFTGTITTTSANELEFAATGLPATAFDGNTITAGSGYTLEQQDTGTSRAATEDADLFATGQYAGRFNLSAATNWTAVVATFEAASSTSAPPVISDFVPCPNPPTRTCPAEAEIGVAYNTTLQATGGQAPYTWSIVSGSLPPGLGFDPGSGVISGAPTAQGTYTFTIQVTDANSQTATKQFSITVSPHITLAGGALPSGTVNSGYSYQLFPTTGVPPYTFTVASGSLPPNLFIRPDDPKFSMIVGTATQAGTFDFSIQATDGFGATATATFSITINAASAPSITTTSLPNGTQGAAYSATLTATGGTSPYTWSILSGSLSAGLALNASTGAISGTPTNSGTSNFTVQVTDSKSQTASAALSITINPSGGGGTIALVQSASQEGSAIGSISATFPANVTASHLILAFVRMSTTDQTVAVTDNRGNVYTDAVSQAQDADGHQVHLFYAKNVTGGAVTITATFSGINNHPWLAIYEYSGLSTTNPLDQVGHSQGSDNSPFTGTITTTSANELEFAATGLPATAFDGNTVAAGPGYVLEQQDAGTSRAATEDAMTASAGQYAGRFSLSSATNWSAVVATFVMASGVPPLAVGTWAPCCNNEAEVNVTYTSRLTAVGGQSPYSFSVISGSLPPGLNLDPASGVISGTPAGPVATSTFTVQVKDSTLQTATGEFSITVVQHVQMSDGVLPNGVVGQEYRAPLVCSFGWQGQEGCDISVVSGSLPPGLTTRQPTNTQAGPEFVGFPSQAGTFTFTLQGTDTLGATTSASFSITINPSGGGGGITLVQSNALEGSGVGQLSVSFSANNTAGNLIIAFVRMSSTGQTVTVTDNRGNVYTDAVSQSQDADGHQVHIFYAKNVTGGTTTVTATFSGINNHPWLAIYEYSGLSTTNPLDQTARAQGSDNSPFTGTITTTSANELEFAAAGLPATAFDGNTVAEGPGYVLEQQNTGTSRAATEDAITGAAGQYAGRFNLSAPANWTAIVATFH